MRSPAVGAQPTRHLAQAQGQSPDRSSSTPPFSMRLIHPQPVSLKRFILGPLGRAAGAMTGVAIALILSAGQALALEKIVLKLPGIGDVNVTLAELKTFAQTGQATGDFNDLLNDPTVAKELSRDQLKTILTQKFTVGSTAVQVVSGSLKTCPGELVVGAVSQVLYPDKDSKGNPSPLVAAVNQALSKASQGSVTALDVLENLDPKVMTVDVAEALKVYRSIEGKVKPLVDRAGKLTLSELTAMDAAKIRSLLSSANVSEADVKKVEAAVQAFGTIQPGSDLDRLLKQIDLGAILRQAASGNLAGAATELGKIDLNSVNLKPYEGRISGLMIAIMEVVGVPVNKGEACRALR